MDVAASTLSSGKAYHLLCSLVAPRPIAWISSGTDPVNVAPFSWFQAICADPMMVMVSVVDKPDGRKDTARNIQADGEFVVNIARGGQLDRLVATSGDYPADISEADALGLGLEPSQAVAPPRVADCAAHLECRLVEAHRYGRKAATTVFVAEVVHVAVAEALLTDRGVLDTAKAQLPARLGGNDYLLSTDLFSVNRPEP